MNFFAGLGNFARGASQGIDDAEKIRGAMDKAKLRNAYKDGISGAKKQRQEDIDKGVRSAYEGGIKMGYEDPSGKVHGDEQQARKAAEKGAPDVMEYFMNDAAPKIGQLYMEQGSPEKAQAWDAWVQDSKGKKAIEQWSGAYKSMMSGDVEDAAEKFGQFYNDQIDDSVDFRGSTPMKNENGDVTGFKIKLYDRDDKEMRDMELTRDQMVQMGNAYNPQALFERITSQTDQASTLAAESAMDEAQANREFEQKAAMEGIKSGNRMEEMRVENQLENAQGGEVRQKFNSNVGILREQGFDDDQIKELTPRILGISNTRAGASDRDLRLNALKMLTSDYMSRRDFEGLPEEQQEQKINAIVDMIKATQK